MHINKRHFRKHKSTNLKYTSYNIDGIVKALKLFAKTCSHIESTLLNS